MAKMENVCFSIYNTQIITLENRNRETFMCHAFFFHEIRGVKTKKIKNQLGTKMNVKRVCFSVQLPIIPISQITPWKTKTTNFDGSSHFVKKIRNSNYKKISFLEPLRQILTVFPSISRKLHPRKREAQNFPGSPTFFFKWWLKPQKIEISLGTTNANVE